MRPALTRYKNRKPCGEVVNRSPDFNPFLNGLKRRGATSSRGSSFCILRAVARIRFSYVVNLLHMF
jgi:hypothetical protein